jgi:hypothetical protein
MIGLEFLLLAATRNFSRLPRAVLSDIEQVPESSNSDQDSIATDSTRTSRKKLMVPWTFVGQRKHDEHCQEQIWKWMDMICEESWKDSWPAAKRK